MQDDSDGIDMRPDDGFRHPEDDPDLPYVSWQQSQRATISYLHGALHLFDQGSEVTKYTWSKTDVPIVDQIRTALDEERYPLFVAEGSSSSKFWKIIHSAYLHKALRSFEGCCDTASACLTIFGHSLAENDRHVLRCITRGKISTVIIGVFGDRSASSNQELISAALKLKSDRETFRGPRYPLDVIFFDAISAQVWG